MIPGQLGPMRRVSTSLRRLFTFAMSCVRILGDRDRQIEVRVERLEDRVGGERRRHEDDGGVRVLRLDGLVDGVVDGGRLRPPDRPCRAPRRRRRWCRTRSSGRRGTCLPAGDPVPRRACRRRRKCSLGHLLCVLHRALDRVLKRLLDFHGSVFRISIPPRRSCRRAGRPPSWESRRTALGPR